MEDIQDSVSDHLKCPICFEIPKDKMFQCRNGHRFCEDCLKKFREKLCPQCKDRIPKNPIRCIAVEELLDSFGLEFPCQFKSSGCKMKWDRKEIGEHNSSCKYDFGKFGQLENVCGYFGFKNCSFTFNRGNIDESLNHFQHEHKMRSIKALLSNQFKIQYEDFKAIFNSSETTIFTPLIFDQRWWGHNFIYIIVIRFNSYDKTLQFLPFYLSHGSIVSDKSNGFPEHVKFNLGEANATVRPQLLFNFNGRSLSDSTYFAVPLNSKMGFNKEKPSLFFSSLEIKISEKNTPQPPTDVQANDVFITALTILKPIHVLTLFLLYKRWPPHVRPVSAGSASGPRNMYEVEWLGWKRDADAKQRYASSFTSTNQLVFICRANINEKWHVGAIYLDIEINTGLIRTRFQSPFLINSEETYDLDEDFEVLYTPPGSYQWAAWKDAMKMEPLLVDEEDKSLLICEWRGPKSQFIGALKRGMVPDGYHDIYVLVFIPKRK